MSWGGITHCFVVGLQPSKRCWSVLRTSGHSQRPKVFMHLMLQPFVNLKTTGQNLAEAIKEIVGKRDTCFLEELPLRKNPKCFGAPRGDG